MGAATEVEHAAAADSSDPAPLVGKMGKEALDPPVLEVLRRSTVSISASLPPSPPGIHRGARASTASRRHATIGQGSHH